MFYSRQKVQTLSLIGFISHMFVELAKNEMDERDCNQYSNQTKKCPLRKLVITNPK